MRLWMFWWYALSAVAYFMSMLADARADADGVPHHTDSPCVRCEYSRVWHDRQMRWLRRGRT